jgi:hypothetical protein
VTPESQAYLVRKLSEELDSFERMPVRDFAEARERRDRCDALRRDIARVKAGQQAIGHP